MIAGVRFKTKPVNVTGALLQLMRMNRRINGIADELIAINQHTRALTTETKELVNDLQATVLHLSELKFPRKLPRFPKCKL